MTVMCIPGHAACTSAPLILRLACSAAFSSVVKSLFLLTAFDMIRVYISVRA